MGEFLTELELFCEKHQLDDSMLGDAYESVGARGRAILKTSIAALYDAFPPEAVLASSIRHSVYDQGSIEFRQTPVDAVIIVFPSYVSAASLLALAVPAMTSGAVEVVCVCLSENLETPRAQAMAALELAGVENVLTCTEEELCSFLDGVDISAGSTLCLGLSFSSSEIGFPSHVTQAFFATPQLGIFISQDSGVKNDVDLDALQTAFEGDEVALWNCVPVSGARSHFFSQNTGSWEQFCAADYNGVLVPPEIFEAAGKVFSFVMGPGCEGLWLYPQCRRELFMRQQSFASF